MSVPEKGSLAWWKSQGEEGFSKDPTTAMPRGPRARSANSLLTGHERYKQIPEPSESNTSGFRSICSKYVNTTNVLATTAVLGAGVVAAWWLLGGDDDVATSAAASAAASAAESSAKSGISKCLPFSIFSGAGDSSMGNLSRTAS